MYLSLEEIKKHLNIELDFTEDDQYLESLYLVAVNVIEIHIDFPLDCLCEREGGELPAPLRHALLLYIGNLYANRESVSLSGFKELPFSYNYLLDLYRNYSKQNGNSYGL